MRRGLFFIQFAQDTFALKRVIESNRPTPILGMAKKSSDCLHARSSVLTAAVKPAHATARINAGE